MKTTSVIGFGAPGCCRADSPYQLVPNDPGGPRKTKCWPENCPTKSKHYPVDQGFPIPSGKQKW